MFGGFRERAEHTYQLLKAPGTSFVVVAAPEPDALREASYFVERLVRRVDAAGRPRAEPDAHHRPGLAAAARGRRRAATAAAAATAAGGPAHPRRCCACTPSAAAAEHDARLRQRFSAAHPEVSVVALPGAAGRRPRHRRAARDGTRSRP